MGVARRHKLPGSERRDLYQSSDMSTIFALVFFAPHHSGCSEGEADGCYAHSEPASQSRNAELGDLVFIARGKQACSLSWRKMLPHPAKLLAANTSLRNGLRMLSVQCSSHTRHEWVTNAETRLPLVVAAPSSLCFPFILLFLNFFFPFLLVYFWNIFLLYTFVSVNLRIPVSSPISADSASVDSAKLGSTDGTTAFYVRDWASADFGVRGGLGTSFPWIPMDSCTQWISTFSLVALEILACIFNLV